MGDFLHFCSVIMVVESVTGHFEQLLQASLLSKFGFIYYSPSYSNGGDILFEGEIPNTAIYLRCYSFNPHFLALSVLEFLLFLLLISK